MRFINLLLSICLFYRNHGREWSFPNLFETALAICGRNVMVRILLTVLQPCIRPFCLPGFLWMTSLRMKPSHFSFLTLTLFPRWVTSAVLDFRFMVYPTFFIVCSQFPCFCEDIVHHGVCRESLILVLTCCLGCPSSDKQ